MCASTSTGLLTQPLILQFFYQRSSFESNIALEICSFTLSALSLPPDCQTFQISEIAMLPRWLTLRSCYKGSKDDLGEEPARLGENTVGKEGELLYRRAKCDA